MLPAKEQRAVPIGGASLVSFKGINDAQKKAAYQFLTYLVSPRSTAPGVALPATSPRVRPPTIRRK